MAKLDIDPAQWRTLSRLLDEALDRPVTERAAWIDSLGAEHDALKPRLRELFTAAGVETGDFMHTLPPVPGVGAVLQRSDLAAGTNVGPYRLMRILGSGGMGEVWLAERADKLINRTVALKLPHLLAIGRAGLAERLAREREILATLDHRNIARLLDAGVTEDGQPFLALEYVEGIAVDQYCAAGRLDIPARLKLFRQMADAVAYAHGKLVVHRDLKPANILVTADGGVKLLDFGIAKLLDEGRAKETRLTELSGRAFTPDYASPEQIRGEPLTVASDVYSLGVVLYELLTGARPYRLKRDSRGALEDAILQADPVRPSEVVPAALRKALRGDLDTIVLKALKKQSTERYATVNEFIDDVQRHLQNQPVLARPDGGWYRLGKFVHRHRVGVAATAIAIAAVVVGASVAVWQARMARAEQRRAEAVKNFIAQTLVDANPFDSSSSEPTIESLLLAARDRVPEPDPTNAALRVELLSVVGAGLQGLGKYDAAEQSLREAIDEGQRILGPSHPLTLHARVALTSVHRFKGREEQVRADLDELIPLLRAKGAGGAEDLALALSNVAHLAIDQRRFDDARAAAGEAHEISARALGPEHDTTVGYALLSAFTRQSEDDPQGSLVIAREALDLVLRAYQHRPTHARVLDARYGYGDSLCEAGRYAEGVAELRAVLRDVQASMGQGASMAGFVGATLARCELAEGDPAASLSHALQSLDIKRSEVAEDSYAMAMAQFHVARAQLALHSPAAALDALAIARRAMAHSRGEDSVQVGDLDAMRALALAQDEKLAAARQLIEPWLDRIRREPVSPTKSRVLHAAGVLELWADQVEDAATLQDEALAALPKRPILAAQRTSIVAEQARLALERNELRGCRALLGQVAPRSNTATTPVIASLRLTEGRLLLSEGRTAEAVVILQGVASYWGEHRPGSRWHGEAEYWLANALAGAGQSTEANAARDRARATMRTSKGFPLDTSWRRVLASGTLPRTP